MTNLRKIEQNNINYAITIAEIIQKSSNYSHEQLVDFLKQIAKYLYLTGEEIGEYNEAIEQFKEIMTKLP